VEMVMPGDKPELTVELDKPVAMEGQSRFAVRGVRRMHGDYRIPTILNIAVGIRSRSRIVPARRTISRSRGHSEARRASVTEANHARAGTINAPWSGPT
jgi:hypothetical protein